MSRPINEEEPFKDLTLGKGAAITPCIQGCGTCAECIRYVRSINQPKPAVQVPELSIISRAEFYQVALREEGEAKAKLLEAEQALAVAQEAFSDASTQLTLTREGLFKACGL